MNKRHFILRDEGREICRAELQMRPIRMTFHISDPEYDLEKIIGWTEGVLKHFVELGVKNVVVFSANNQALIIPESNGNGLEKITP